jgi:hypothetical protein
MVPCDHPTFGCAAAAVVSLPARRPLERDTVAGVCILRERGALSGGSAERAWMQACPWASPPVLQVRMDGDCADREVQLWVNGRQSSCKLRVRD